MVAEAGYVDLYRDASFEHKLKRVKDVVVDVCYTFKCDQEAPLDNMITSAKWHDLPETGDFFGGGDATIVFYIDQNCKGKSKSWLVKTQSKKKLYFPDNFRLDGMNDAISSFKVINVGGNAGVLYACASPESTTATNTTANQTSSGYSSTGHL
ncbi:Equilibrative Nucleoside transporter (ENT) Family [Phytophthora cinnamomi]|uniref:Equilibrative Nucleoside transporter (ENT) Family n=1 Tax=Phytophthora cinnamomi TaxID=4785 RepID=UPI00355994E5|nr:Equilibrative Nucleoside transporter (ENT) Family [Phytophthora cinnamomi]